jgi:predicted lipid-binding transport protein (Tim44 family)
MDFQREEIVKMKKKMPIVLVLITLIFFGIAAYIEATAWAARAGGGRSFGSRGSRSFSTPQSPSRTAPGVTSPGRNAAGMQQPSGGLTRSPFMQGLAGGLAGGMIGSLLFGGSGHAAGPGAGGGGGIGFLEILIIGGLLYFAYRYFKKRREQAAVGAGYYADASSPRLDSYSGGSPTGYSQSPGSFQEAPPAYGQLEQGTEQIRRYDPTFSEEGFKETVQDIFFRIQAGWTNRSLNGIESILTGEMADYFAREFESMKRKGTIDHLENIAIRKVEISEAWQETGKDYITVLFTANLLDYTVNADTREVVAGDKMNPVKFQEFWTFSRDIGSGRWQLSAINQIEQ